MTYRKAIEIIKSAQAQIEWDYPMDYAVAFDMAISALQAQDVPDINVGGMISKQAAIDALNAYEDVVDTASQVFIIRGCKKAITNLPSVQPELCEDAVSRRILLHDLKELITAWEKYPVMAEQIKGVETAIGYVDTIPSVTPKRKTGKWIRHPEWQADGECGYECDQCGMGSDVDYDFCMKCGAKMDGNE